MTVHELARSALLVAALVAGASLSVAAQDISPGPRQATTLLDLSGLVSVGGVCCRGEEQVTTRMLAAHDGKNPEENDLPRISVLRLTDSPVGVTWEPLDLEWPDMPEGPANDLESAAAIPGTSGALFLESGDDGGPFHRIFHVELALDVPNAGRVVDVVAWPVRPHNVEAAAVALVDEEFVFIYAERAQGESTTMIRWAPMTLSPLGFGGFQEAAFHSPAVHGPQDRPISAMEVGPGGVIYVASAFDSGNDDGPFASTIWAAGQVVGGAAPSVILDDEPQLIARLDAFKTESLAMHVHGDGREQLFAGTDDEDYGGVLRPIPAAP